MDKDGERLGQSNGKTSRAAFLARLTCLIAALRRDDVLRVAIDGPDTAGKTTMANELAHHLVKIRPVARASIDGFHQPREIRRRRGKLSAEGYYHDSFDYDALRTCVLEPLGPVGDRRYRSAVFDHRSEAARDVPWKRAEAGTVLLFDGVFLLRPELRDHWDLSVFVEVGPDETLRRALARDVNLFGDAETVLERYRLRYLPGQDLYRAEASPADRADIVVDNDEPQWPRVLKWPETTLPPSP